MSRSLPNPRDARHLISHEPQAKAQLKEIEITTWRTDIGLALGRAIQLRGWTLKEFAAAVPVVIDGEERSRDLGQCSRWISGQERPQMDVIFAAEDLRLFFLQALAECAERAGDAVTLRTTIEFATTQKAVNE